jgi:hypothetical protein
MAEPKQARALTASERFVAATRQVLSVSKAELEKREKAWRAKRSKPRRPA